jgi:hypothetical protein
MDALTLRTHILNNGYTNADLNLLGEAIRYARSQLGNEIKQTLCVGVNVNWTNSRTGKNITGHVTKIAQKYVTVQTVDGLWKVPAAMLTVIDDQAHVYPV